VSKMIENFTQFRAFHYAMKPTDNLRMGQRFINMYIKNDSDHCEWFKGMYQADDARAYYLILNWLLDHNYYDTMPTPLHPC